MYFLEDSDCVVIGLKSRLLEVQVKISSGEVDELSGGLGEELCLTPGGGEEGIAGVHKLAEASQGKLLFGGAFNFL